MSDNTSRTLVTGATGNIGRPLVRLLVAAGAEFRVMSRRQEQVDAFTARSVDAVRGDFTEPAAVRAALDGCDQLFLLPPATPDLAEQARAAIDAAREAGVRHVVKVSASDAAADSVVPWAAAHAQSDAYLEKSGLAWTVLKPACFMSNLMPLAPAIRRGFLPGTSGHGATPWIAEPDIAAAAAAVLGNPATHGGPGRDGHSYRLTGTEPMSFPEVASVLTKELGRRVRYLHLPAPLMHAGLRAAGTSRWQARGLTNQFSVVVRHGLDDVRVVSSDLTDLIGRAPVGLAGYVRDQRGALT